MLVDEKIIEAMIAYLSNIPCGTQMGDTLNAGLVYSYLVVQLQQNRETYDNTGTDGDNKDQS